MGHFPNSLNRQKCVLFSLIAGNKGAQLIYSRIEYYKNEGNKSNANFVKKTGSANPFDGIAFGFCAAPTLIDFDGDGKIDALVGNRNGLLNYCPNSGTATKPSYACTDSYSDATPAGNPFINIDIRKTDKGGVVTSGKSGTDSGTDSYTKPFAVDVVSLLCKLFQVFIRRQSCCFLWSLSLVNLLTVFLFSL